jgi:hypothetical protein
VCFSSTFLVEAENEAEKPTYSGKCSLKLVCEKLCGSCPSLNLYPVAETFRSVYLELYLETRIIPNPSLVLEIGNPSLQRRTQNHLQKYCNLNTL